MLIFLYNEYLISPNYFISLSFAFILAGNILNHRQ